MAYYLCLESSFDTLVCAAVAISEERSKKSHLQPGDNSNIASSTTCELTTLANVATSYMSNSTTVSDSIRLPNHRSSSSKKRVRSRSVLLSSYSGGNNKAKITAKSNLSSTGKLLKINANACTVRMNDCFDLTKSRPTFLSHSLSVVTIYKTA